MYRNIDLYDNYRYIGYDYHNTDGHFIYRYFIFFDTSSIPVGAIITNAILYLRRAPDDEGMSGFDTPFNIVIQDGQPTYPHSPLELADYNRSYYKNNGGSINAEDISPDIYTGINLNSNGIAWINKGGITKFCLRNSREIAGIGYTGVLEYYFERIGICTFKKGAGYQPKLTITYEY